MGRSAVPLETIWPNGSDPKTLVCVRAQCSVAELFNTVFTESDLSEQLHKQRGDADLVHTPWYATKESLPTEMYIWQVADPPNKPSATLRHRKVRFESPATALASKPFQNEESQVVTELYPDTLYVVEAVSSTSAPYGDKFNVFFRYIFRADEPAGARSTLHLVFHVEWLPAMNRMMRPVVGKAVDAGVRGTFKIFRSVLGMLRPVADIREAELPQAGPPAVTAYEPGAAEAEAAAGPGPAEAEAAGAAPYPHVPGHPPAPAAGFAPGLGPPPNLLGALTQQLVYKDQVVLLADLLGAGLRSVSASDLGAQALAAALTVWLISLLVAALRRWQQLCDIGGGGGDGDGGGVLWRPVLLALCWPLALVDLPDSTAEVLSSLALVAAINWAVIRGTETVVRYVNRAHPGLLAARGGDGGDVIGGVPFSQTPVVGPRGSGGGAPLGRAPSGGGAAGGAGGGGGPNRTQPASAPVSRAASAVPVPLPAASATAAKGNEKDKTKGAGGVVGSGASFFAAAAAAVGAAGNGAAAATGPAKPKPMRAAPAPKQFTAAQLRQLELGHVTSSKKSTQPPPPAAPLPLPAAVPAAAAMADAWAADMPAGMVVPAAVPSSPRAPSPPPRSASPSRQSAATVEAPGARSATTAEPAAAAAKLSEAAGGCGGAVSVAAATAAPAAAAAPAPAPAAAAAAQTGSSFANMFTKEGFDSMTEGLRSAFRWDTTKAGDPSDLGSPESTASPSAAALQQHLPKIKARSDAGVVLSSLAGSAPPGLRSGGGGGGSHAAAPAAASYMAGTAAATLSLFSVHSDVPLLAHHEEQEDAVYGGGSEMYGGGGDEEYDGDLEPALVVEEVFENERFQPFRGWGHMWPGHFLPSDRVGHWSDRQGKPGGTASMIFEQVVPQLPRGWRWLEKEWQVDLEGLEVEAVDCEGWTYALDFYLLKFPPPPQGGKCSLKHFVRRRRYYRTRVRAEAVGRSTRSSGDYAGLPSCSPYGSEGVGADEDVGSGGKEKAGKALAADVPAAVAAVAAASRGDEGLAADVPAAATEASRGDEALALAGQERLMSLSEVFLSAAQQTQEQAAPASRPSTAGEGDGGATAPVELQPPALLARSTAADGGGGSLLPRPRSAADGLSEAHALQQQQQQQQQPQPRVEANGQRARSSTSGPAGGTAMGPVKATLELLSGGAGTVRGGDGDTSSGGGSGSGGAVGDAVHPAAEMFVLSPKTEVKSHDPLGALATEVRRPSSDGDGGDSGPACRQDRRSQAAAPAPAAPAAAPAVAPAADGSTAPSSSPSCTPSPGGGASTNGMSETAAAAGLAAAGKLGEAFGEAASSATATAVAAPSPGLVAAATCEANQAADAAAAVAAAVAAAAGDAGDGSIKATTTTAAAAVDLRRSSLRTIRTALSPARAGTGGAASPSPPAPSLAGVGSGRADSDAAAAAAAGASTQQPGGGVPEGPVIAADLIE